MSRRGLFFVFLAISALLSAPAAAQCVAPTITTQPASTSVIPATFTVSVNGTPPINYQWYQGASGIETTPISGAASSSYTTGSLSSTTQYWVRISDACGVVHSDTATAWVGAPQDATAKIVGSFPVPGAAPRGIAWDGSVFWLIDNFENLYRVTPSGASLGSCAFTFESSGLTWDGTNIWAAGTSLRKTDASCAVLESLPINYWANSGIAWGANHFWAADYNFSIIHKHQRDGTALLSWSVPCCAIAHPTGVVFDGANLWIGDSNEGGNDIIKVSTSGTLLFSLSLNAIGINAPSAPFDNALAWDGTYLWDASEGLFTVSKLAICGTLAVAPSSLPSAVQGVSYSQNITASGEVGTAPFSITQFVGTLPPGLTLSTSGALSGTPTSAGIHNFTVTATGANSCAVSKAYSLTVNAPPTVNSVTPNFGRASGGTGVTIAGSNFVTGATVTFGGTAATAVNVTSSTTITATTPAHGAGLVNVVVTNPSTLSGALIDGFNYHDPPTLSSVDPTSGPSTGGTPVTLTGSRFFDGATVRFGSISATNVVVQNATTITATTPAVAPGMVNVTVTNADGQAAALPNAFTFNSPPGNNYYVNATTGTNAPGNGSQAVPWKTITYALSQITGSGHTVHVAAGTYDTTLGETFPINLKNGVSLLGAGAGTTVIDAKGTNLVMRAVGLTDLATSVQQFTIRGGANSNEGGGIFITAGSALKIANNLITGNNVTSSVAGRRYGGGIYILNSSPVILGNEIAANNVVGVRAPSDPSTFGAYGGGIAVSGSTASPVIRQNIIRNNEAKNDVFAVAYGAGICIVNQASPTVDDNTIADNNLHRLYATSGNNFGSGIYIESAGGIVSGNTISSNTLTADFGSLTISSGVYVTGSGVSPQIVKNVISRNQNDGIACRYGATPLIRNNTIAHNTGHGVFLDSPAPSQTSPSEISNTIFYSNEGYAIYENDANSDPGRVTYNLFFGNSSGLYRDENSTDYFSAAALNSSVAESSNNFEGDPLFVDAVAGNYQIRAGSPAIDAGDPASPLDPDGSRADVGALPFAQAAPVITLIDPAAGTTAGGTVVTITGTNFATGAAVRFGSATAASVNVVNATSIMATTAPSAAGTVDVVVTNPDGLRGTLANGFTYIASPSITNVSPIQGPAAGGTAVTITGTNLPGATSVTFGGTAGTITANTATSISVTSPPHNVGTVDLVVTAAGGTVTRPGGYTYLPAPTISTIDPGSGPTGGGTTVTITGTNLADATSVTLGGVAATIVSRTPTSIIVNTPPHPPESSVYKAEAQITVFTGDGLQKINVSGAQDSEEFPLPQGDTRFGFEIITTGTSSFSLQAVGRAGRVDLSWVAADVETLAGYNIYRATQSGGPYTKINSALVFQTTYSDFSAAPTVTHYYVYRVVSTSLEEGPNSNQASAAPIDDAAPVITHIPVVRAPAGSPITIVAFISDNVAVASALLFYRPSGSSGYTQVAMINATGNQFTANIPGNAVVEPGVDYYVQASDGASVASHGSAAAPHQITIGNVSRGDANGDGVLSSADVIYLLNFLFGGGPALLGSGDANGDGVVDIRDVFYLINYFFLGGPAPV